MFSPPILPPVPQQNGLHLTSIAPFVPRDERAYPSILQEPEGPKLASAEALVIRAAMVITAGGHKSLSHPGSTIAPEMTEHPPLAGEAFTILGRKVYLLSTESYLVVRGETSTDLWKETPTGMGTHYLRKTSPLGDGSSALRYADSRFLGECLLQHFCITKILGNTFGLAILVANQSKLGSQTTQRIQVFAIELIAEE